MDKKEIEMQTDKIDDWIERDVETLLRKEVKRLGGYAYKFTSPGNNGVPDRIVIFPDGVIWFVELKTAKGKTTRLQDTQLKRLDKLGQRVYVAHGVKGVISFFDRAGYESTADYLRLRYGVE